MTAMTSKTPYRDVRFVSDTEGAELRESGRMPLPDACERARSLAVGGRRTVRLLAFNEKMRRWEQLREYTPQGVTAGLF